MRPWNSGLLCALALVSLAGCAKPATATNNPGGETEVPASGGDEEPLPPDLNFGCSLEGAALDVWAAEGLELPATVRDSFAAWMTMSSDVVPPELEAACTNPPSGGDYSPVKGATQGGVTRGDIVVATQDITVYRSYSAGTFECGSDKPAGELGSWWSPLEPRPPKQDYRDNVGICPAWNDLSMIVSCTLAAGSVVLIGPTQSASCVGTSSCDPAPEGWEAQLPTTAAPQLFINTYSADGPRSAEDLHTFLLDCETHSWDD